MKPKLYIYSQLNYLIRTAKRRLLLNRPTDRTFENRRGKYKELGKKVPQAYRVYVEDTFLPCDAVIARIFSKEETGLYYYGARYLDPKYSRWLSGDPALGEYMAGSSVGAGGIYNTVNFNVYHYGGNTPIKYTDPTGMYDKDSYDAFKERPRQERNVSLSSIPKSKTINRVSYEATDKIIEIFGKNG